VAKQVLNGAKTKGLESLISNVGKELNLIPIEESMPSWIQDPIEFVFNVKSGKMGVQGLPYPRSPNIYKNIAKSCNFESFKGPTLNGIGGNHGGNIEHLFDDNIMLGDSSSRDLQEFF
jgi:hypothetical protein